MSRVLRDPGNSRQARWLVTVLTVAALAIAACGGGDGDGGDEAGSTANPNESAGGGAAEPILIKTDVDFSSGKARGDVLDGSTIGDSAFCTAGTFVDKHGSEDPNEEPFGLVDRTYSCPDGSLRMGFTPGHPEGGTQAGPWTIVSGTGAYEGLQGSGEMEITYDPANDTKGRETFTGSVTH